MRRLFPLLVTFIFVAGFSGSPSERDPYQHKITDDQAREYFNYAAGELYPLGEFRRARIKFNYIYNRSTGDLRDDALYYVGKTYYHEGKFGRLYDTFRKLAIEFPEGNIIKNGNLLESVRNIQDRFLEDLHREGRIKISSNSWSQELYRLTEKTYFIIKLATLVKDLHPGDTSVEVGTREILESPVRFTGDTSSLRMVGESVSRGFQGLLNSDLVYAVLNKIVRIEGGGGEFTFGDFLHELGVGSLNRFDNGLRKKSREYIERKRKEFDDI